MKVTLNKLIPELYCKDIALSVEFYTRMLDFTILYDRPEDSFAMLDHHGAQIMLRRLNEDSSGNWLVATLEHPFGRGINLQIETNDVEWLYKKLVDAAVKIFLSIEKKHYRANTQVIVQQQFIIEDPDGYLLRFHQTIN